MIHEPLVSVVIPVFNGERFIETALASVFKQTYNEIEIIVVNDGSTDKTIEHLDKYRGKIKIISITNSGTPSVPRNIGIVEAKGEYIAFLDQDDIWQPFKLQHCISALEKNSEVGCLFSDFNRFEWHDMSFYALSNSQIFPFIYEEIRSFKWFEYKYFRIVKEKMFTLLLRGYPIYHSTMIGRVKSVKKGYSYSKVYPCLCSIFTSKQFRKLMPFTASIEKQFPKTNHGGWGSIPDILYSCNPLQFDDMSPSLSLLSFLSLHEPCLAHPKFSIAMWH